MFSSKVKFIYSVIIVLLNYLSSALVSKAPNIKVATCQHPVILSALWMDADVGSISVFVINVAL